MEGGVGQPVDHQGGEAVPGQYGQFEEVVLKSFVIGWLGLTNK